MPARRPLVTTGELAILLGISKTTIQRYHRSGDLTPAELTPAGHPRWIEVDVREQMRRLRERRKDGVEEE
jgi:DNA-binding transcriptional MerR regulator